MVRSPKRFVRGVRNGIFHEAETRKWVIWREEPAGEIAAQEDDGYALNRSLFYAAAEKELEARPTWSVAGHFDFSGGSGCRRDGKENKN